MNWKVQIKLRLAFFGDKLDPIEFSKLINIHPANYWYKGDDIPIRKENGIELKGIIKPKRKETCWEFETDYTETYFIEDLVEPLLDKFEPVVNIIAEYINENKLETQLSVIAECVVGESTPALGANKRLIQFLAKINGWIDEDLYILEKPQVK